MTKSLNKRELTAVRLAASKMLEAAIDVISEDFGDDPERCNLMMCIALGLALTRSEAIDPRIGRIAAKIFLEKGVAPTVH